MGRRDREKKKERKERERERERDQPDPRKKLEITRDEANSTCSHSFQSRCFEIQCLPSGRYYTSERAASGCKRVTRLGRGEGADKGGGPHSKGIK